MCVYNVVKRTTAIHIKLIGRKEMLYLMKHSTHYIYGYMALVMC